AHTQPARPRSVTPLASVREHPRPPPPRGPAMPLPPTSTATTSRHLRLLIATLGAATIFLAGCVVGLLAERDSGGASGGFESVAGAAPADVPALAEPGAAGYKSRVAEIAARVSPSVVSIGAVRRVAVRDPFFDDF